MSERKSTKTIVLIGLFSALAYAFAVIGHFIPLRIAGFLSYDPKDVIVVMSGFALGPVAAYIISIITALIELITISTTGPWGFLMNVLSTTAFACSAALVYRKRRTLSGAILGLFLGIIVMTTSMLLWNYFITPLYMGVEREVVANMLTSVFLPFNLLKSTANAALAMILYKPMVKILRKTNLLESESKEQHNAKFIIIAVSVGILIASVLLFLVLGGVI